MDMPVGQTITRLFLQQQIKASILWQVKLDTMLTGGKYAWTFCSCHPRQLVARFA